ncbi:hypothetical protein [Steroidobacter sp.]|uniref:hypothetical protein n=1 Tax=Steroidobacter sp. TaxID=1978227 RepID=UPI001A5DAB8B|nr:hypothetical protein [Steroidobacter sp.]MBL8265500.1 hypothetical protein [Steroidobacter sp.]
MAEALITDPKEWRAALSRVVVLVRAGDTDSAQAQVAVMTRWTPPDAPYEASVAEAFQAAASAAGADRDVVAFEWLWKKAFNYWYAWGSGASSGGEGAARGELISQADAAYQRERRQLGLG